MKKYLKIILAGLVICCFLPLTSRAQSIADCLDQLALDYQKLSGLKNILSQMYTGYEILTKGYNSVKEVSQGNFDLHKVFLDGLLVVSPTVRKYPRVADIIHDQALLLKEYDAAWNSFRQDKHFTPDELGYMLDVYNNLVSRSLKNLSDLAMILTDRQVRMNDAERLAAIDHIYTGSRAQLDFLHSFNDHNYRLTMLRAHAAGDRQTLKILYGN
jgi:hypothetical protein